MGYGAKPEYQQAGYKAMERFDITIRVIEGIDLMGDLYTSIRFRGINQESQRVYEAFINAFFKIFHITASMLKKEDLETIVKVETAFMEQDITLTPETSGKFLSLFEDYLHAMKEAGVYDPAVIKSVYNPLSAWQESV